MKFLSRYQTVLIVISLIIVGFVVYTIAFTGKDDTVLKQSGAGPSASVDNELIALLLELKALKLDDSIFANPAFQSLQDFSQELIPEPVGRDNPFAPPGSGQ